MTYTVVLVEQKIKGEFWEERKKKKKKQRMKTSEGTKAKKRKNERKQEKEEVKSKSILNGETLVTWQATVRKIATNKCK